MKLHLGCWHRHIPGFVHVDLCEMPHIDHRHRIDALPFIADGAAELVYCSHAFEYFDRQEAPRVLAEWHRVLRPGGVLRLAVPDFEALIQVYRMTGTLERVLGPLYGRMEIASATGPQCLYHRTCYDQASLTRVLEAAGFGRVRPWDWRRTEHAHIDDHSQAHFPHMDKTSGLLVSLNLEAERLA